MVYDGDEIKRILQEFFQERLKHPRESNPQWDAEWLAPGGPREHLMTITASGPQVDENLFHRMREEDFE
eukprot:gene4913-79_t